MKDFSEKLAALPDKAIIGISLVGALILSGVVIAIVLLPSFGVLGEVAAEIETEEAKLSAIETSIAQLSREDKERLVSLVEFLNTYVPEKVDSLHFATLNELVSEAAGVSVNSIIISKGVAKAAPPVTTAPGVQTSSGAAPTTPVQATQTAATSVTVTYTSSFDALLTLLKYWSLADQLVGIKEITVNGLDTTSLNYTVSYELPNSPTSAKATIDDKLSLTEEQKKKIEELESKIIYTATPSAKSVGKSNPFE